jgi:hypothetical protein
VTVVRGPRALVCLLLLAAITRALEPEPGSSVDPPSTGDLVAEALRVQDLDLAAWPRYAFTREVLRQRFDRHGAVAFEQRLLFRVTPRGDGFDEELLSIDGRRPTRSEVEEHRQAGRFTRHYRQALEGSIGGGYTLDDELNYKYLLEAFRYRYEGVAEMLDVRSHRLAIVPSPEARRDGLDALAAATEGGLWLSEDGLHLVRAETRLVRRVSRTFAGIRQLDVLVEGQSAGDVWLPRRVEIRSHVRLFGNAVRKRNVYVYTDLAPAAPGG